jgi:hypothetical protein
VSRGARGAGGAVRQRSRFLDDLRLR